VPKNPSIFWVVVILSAFGIPGDWTAYIQILAADISKELSFS
jgi:hypothetical protein